MFSACCCSWLWVLNFDSFVTPSTSRATSAPKRSSMSVRPYSVSSGTSWRSAAVTATGSIPSSAVIWADAIGWVTYGSPVARRWPSWASTARSNAAPDRARGRPAGSAPATVSRSVRPEWRQRGSRVAASAVGRLGAAAFGAGRGAACARRADAGAAAAVARRRPDAGVVRAEPSARRIAAGSCSTPRRVPLELSRRSAPDVERAGQLQRRRPRPTRP